MTEFEIPNPTSKPLPPPQPKTGLGFRIQDLWGVGVSVVGFRVETSLLDQAATHQRAADGGLLLWILGDNASASIV